MIRLIHILATQPHTARLCRRAGVAVDTWMAITINDAHDADTRTGRNMRTSQAVAAARVGRSEKQVQRARDVSVALGIMVEMYRGRELSRAERLALTADQPGHKQRGLPNSYAMCVCGPRQRARISVPRPGQYARVRPHTATNVHLPPEGGPNNHQYLLELLPLTAATAAEKTEPPPAARHRHRKRAGTALAVALLTHPALHTLLEGVRPATIAAQLAPYHAGGWHEHDLADVLVQEARRLHISTCQPARSPWGLLKVLLRRVDPAGGAQPAASDVPQPCDAADCDGHGWINGEDADGHPYARPCPTCPPRIRTTWAAEPAGPQWIRTY